ncbi:MAG: glycogen/starch/alpha-glucan phosphorylase [Streptococcus salivarius]
MITNWLLNVTLKANKGIDLDENSIIDTQIKRFHEYKRQQMNALYVIHKYLEIKKGNLPKRKITIIFGGKAAPAYVYYTRHHPLDLVTF